MFRPPATTIPPAPRIDPRFQLTAYLHDDTEPKHRFYEVVGEEDDRVVLLDCFTMHRCPFARSVILQRFTLVRAAMLVPDAVDLAA